jgi:hypothetical protein
LTWPRNHDRGSRFSGQDCVSGHLLVIYQVKRLLDLDFIHQTRVSRTTKTRKELPGKSSVALRPPPPGFILGMLRSRIWTDGPSWDKCIKLVPFVQDLSYIMRYNCKPTIILFSSLMFLNEHSISFIYEYT